MSGHDRGPGPEPPHRPRGGAERHGPPEDGRQCGRQERERHEQPQPDRRVEDVAGADGVRPGELVRLEERTAGEPPRRRVAIELVVDADGLLERMRGDGDEHERQREDRDGDDRGHAPQPILVREQVHGSCPHREIVPRRRRHITRMVRDRLAPVAGVAMGDLPSRPSMGLISGAITTHGASGSAIGGRREQWE